MIWTTCSHSLCVFLKTFYREPYRPWSGTLEKEKKIDKSISFDIVIFFLKDNYVWDLFIPARNLETGLISYQNQSFEGGYDCRTLTSDLLGVE